MSNEPGKLYVVPKNPSLRFSLWFSRHSFEVDFANSHGLNIYFLRNLISMACGEHRVEKPANPFQFTRFAIPVCVILRWKDLTQKCVKINGIVLLLFFEKRCLESSYVSSCFLVGGFICFTALILMEYANDALESLTLCCFDAHRKQNIDDSFATSD